MRVICILLYLYDCNQNNWMANCHIYVYIVTRLSTISFMQIARRFHEVVMKFGVRFTFISMVLIIKKKKKEEEEEEEEEEEREWKRAYNWQIEIGEENNMLKIGNNTH